MPVDESTQHAQNVTGATSLYIYAYICMCDIRIYSNAYLQGQISQSVLQQNELARDLMRVYAVMNSLQATASVADNHAIKLKRL